MTLFFLLWIVLVPFFALLEDCDCSTEDEEDDCDLLEDTKWYESWL